MKKDIPIVLASELAKTMTGKCWFTFYRALELQRQGKLRIINDCVESETKEANK